MSLILKDISRYDSGLQALNPEPDDAVTMKALVLTCFKGCFFNTLHP